MSARQSLDIERSECAHYYHCIIYGVPQETPLSQVAQHVTPQPQSALVKELASLGCRIVPHQLHMYKEPLKAKFGYVSYFVHNAPTSRAGADDVHPLVVRWVSEDLVPQLLLVHCQVKLAQPPECHSSEPFLDAFNRLSPLLDPRNEFDTRKMETFILSKVTFNDDGSNEASNRVRVLHRGSFNKVTSSCDPEEGREVHNRSFSGGSSNSADARDWSVVGSFAPLELEPLELVWLKRELSDFPPLLITNKDISTAHCDTEMLVHYFAIALAPLFTVATE